MSHHLEESKTEVLHKSVEGSWMLRLSLLCGSLIFCPFCCFCRIISCKVYVSSCTDTYAYTDSYIKVDLDCFYDFQNQFVLVFIAVTLYFLGHCKCTVPQVVRN